MSVRLVRGLLAKAAPLWTACITSTHVFAASPPALRDGLDWPGIHLDMTLEAWKAAPFPGKGEPTCTKAASAGVHSPPTASSGVVVCEYEDRLGRFALPQGVSLGPKWLASHLRFTFVDQRLSRIDYQISVDAFDDLSARLTTRFGAPASITRDRVRTEAGSFPRVRVRWNTAEGVVQLIDPAPPFNVLSVSLADKSIIAGRPT